MYHHHHQLSMEVSDYYPKDHFIVEDLFNFSTDDPNDLSAADGGSASFNAAATNFTDSSGVTAGENYASSFSFSAYDFSEPSEEVAELEWLSNFVEDCFSNNSDHQFSASSSPATTTTTTSSQFTGMPSAIPAKARSKRSRANPSSWAARLPVLSGAPAAEPATSAGDVTAAVGRRCLHCGSEKTPQWRMGPMGPKTLCNACGVRYKSGRLVPEYRPAASPTFVTSEHSNSHRKVVELRRQKEEEELRQQHRQMVFWS